MGKGQPISAKRRAHAIKPLTGDEIKALTHIVRKTQIACRALDPPRVKQIMELMLSAGYRWDRLYFYPVKAGEISSA